MSFPPSRAADNGLGGEPGLDPNQAAMADEVRRLLQSSEARSVAITDNVSISSGPPSGSSGLLNISAGPPAPRGALSFTTGPPQAAPSPAPSAAAPSAVAPQPGVLAFTSAPQPSAQPAPPSNATPFTAPTSTPPATTSFDPTRPGRATPASVLKARDRIYSGEFAPSQSVETERIRTHVAEVAKKLRSTIKKGPQPSVFASLESTPTEAIFAELQMLVNQVTKDRLEDVLNKVKNAMHQLYEIATQEAKAAAAQGGDVAGGSVGAAVHRAMIQHFERLVGIIHKMVVCSEAFCEQYADLLARLRHVNWKRELLEEPKLLERTMLTLCEMFFVDREKPIPPPVGPDGSLLPPGPEYDEALSLAKAIKLKEQRCNFKYLCLLFRRQMVRMKIIHGILRQLLQLPPLVPDSAPQPPPQAIVNVSTVPSHLDIQLATQLLLDLGSALQQQILHEYLDAYVARLHWIYRALGEGNVKEHSKVCFEVLELLEGWRDDKSRMKGPQAQVRPPSQPERPAAQRTGGDSGAGRVPARTRAIAAMPSADRSAVMKELLSACKNSEVAQLATPTGAWKDALGDFVATAGDCRSSARTSAAAAAAAVPFVVGYLAQAPAGGAAAYGVAMALGAFGATRVPALATPEPTTLPSATAVSAQQLADALSLAFERCGAGDEDATVQQVGGGGIKLLTALASTHSEPPSEFVKALRAGGDASPFRLSLLDAGVFGAAGATLDADEIAETPPLPKAVVRDVLALGRAAYDALRVAPASSGVVRSIMCSSVEHSALVAALHDVEGNAFTQESVAGYPTAVQAVLLSRGKLSDATVEALRVEIRGVPPVCAGTLAGSWVTLAVALGARSAADAEAIAATMAPIVGVALMHDRGVDAQRNFAQELLLCDAAAALPVAKPLPQGWMSAVVGGLKGMVAVESVNVQIARPLPDRMAQLRLPPGFVPLVSKLTTTL